MNLDFQNKYRNIYFLGIGGISMSGLAEILLKKGLTISGSDINRSDIVKHLESLGVKINIGHNKENITDDIDLLVYTAAVKPENEEILMAIKKNIPIVDRAELLGNIMRDYKKSIAISGTHGKTTTTSMVSEILLKSNGDPTISIGGILPSINGNIKVGDSDIFVAEACEYFDSFLKFSPYIAIILNVEHDHIDYFKDLKQIQDSFKSFAQKVPKNGYVIINSDIENFGYITENLECNIITFGSDSKNTIHPINIVHDDNGKNSFNLMFKNENMGVVTLNVPGSHNINNSLAAFGATYCLGIDKGDIIKGLFGYTGVNRRFQFKGNVKGADIYDDYAHHPTEVRATLAAAKNIKHNDLWCIFQPHTYTRTSAFLDDFTDALSGADKVIVSDIYAAREKDTLVIHSRDLVKKIKSGGKDVLYFGNFSDIEDYVKSNIKRGDLILTMGAGDVYLIGENLAKN